MQSEQEIRQLKEELAKLTGFIADFGTEQQQGDKSFQFCCDVSVALDWVLGKTTTEKFKGDTYLFLERLKQIVREIEMRTGKSADQLRADNRDRLRRQRRLAEF